MASTIRTKVWLVLLSLCALLFSYCLTDTVQSLNCGDVSSAAGSTYKLLGTYSGISKNALPSILQGNQLEGTSFIKVSVQVSFTSFDTAKCQVTNQKLLVVGDSSNPNTQWTQCDVNSKGKCYLLSTPLDITLDIEAPRWRLSPLSKGALDPFPFDTVAYKRTKTESLVYDDDEEGIPSCYTKHSGSCSCNWHDCNCDSGSLNHCSTSCAISSLCNAPGQFQNATYHTYTAEQGTDKSCGQSSSSYLACNQQSNSYGTTNRFLDLNNIAYVTMDQAGNIIPLPLSPSNLYESTAQDNYPSATVIPRTSLVPCKLSQNDCLMTFIAGHSPAGPVSQTFSKWSNLCSVVWDPSETHYAADNGYTKSLWFMTGSLYDKLANRTDEANRWVKPWSFAGSSSTSKGNRYTALTCVKCNPTDGNCDKSTSSLVAERFFLWNVAPVCRGYSFDFSGNPAKLLWGSVFRLQKHGNSGSLLEFYVLDETASTGSPGQAALASSDNYKSSLAVVVSYVIDQTIKSQVSSSNLANLQGFAVCADDPNTAFGLGPAASKFPYIDYYKSNPRLCRGCTPLQQPIGAPSSQTINNPQLFFTFTTPQFQQLFSTDCDGSTGSPGTATLTNQEPPWGGFSAQSSITASESQSVLNNVCSDASRLFCRINSNGKEASIGSPCQAGTAFDQWYTNFQAYLTSIDANEPKADGPNWNNFMANEFLPSFYKLNSFPNLWYDLNDDSGKSLIFQPNLDDNTLAQNPMTAQIDYYISEDYVQVSAIDILKVDVGYPSNYQDTNLCLLIDPDDPQLANVVPPSAVNDFKPPADQESRCPKNTPPISSNCAYLTFTIQDQAGLDLEPGTTFTLSINQTLCNANNLILFGNDITTNSFQYTAGTQMKQKVFVTYITPQEGSVLYLSSACSFDIIQQLSTGQILIAGTVRLPSCADTYNSNQAAISSHGGSLYVPVTPSSTPLPASQSSIPSSTPSALSNPVTYPTPSTQVTTSPSPTPNPSKPPYSVCYLDDPNNNKTQYGWLNESQAYYGNHSRYCHYGDFTCEIQCAGEIYGLWNEILEDPYWWAMWILVIIGIVILVLMAFCIANWCERRDSRKNQDKIAGQQALAAALKKDQ